MNIEKNVKRRNRRSYKLAPDIHN